MSEDLEDNDDLIPGIDEDESVEGTESISDPFDPTEIRVERSSPTIDLLIRRIKHGEINLAPDFQRKGGIWTEEAQSRLIESILIRIPLPAFYVDATDENHWLVVDGLQRLTTLKRFVLEGSLVLRGLEFLKKDLDGKAYKELPRNLQRRIEETEVTVFLIQPGTPPEVKFNIFKRINTGGLPLSPQEIRNAINGSRGREFIKGLAESKAFTKATRNSIGDKRMADRECVTRFIAFRINDPMNYKGKDFDGFLNLVMRDIDDPKRISDAELKNLGAKFEAAMKAALVIFERYAFRKYYGGNKRVSPINKALFEATACNLAALTSEQIELLQSRRSALLEGFALLHQDQNFLSAISQGTGDPGKIRVRFNSIKQLIERTLNNDQDH